MDHLVGEVKMQKTDRSRFVRQLLREAPERDVSVASVELPRQAVSRLAERLGRSAQRKGAEETGASHANQSPVSRLMKMLGRSTPKSAPVAATTGVAAPLAMAKSASSEPGVLELDYSNGPSAPFSLAQIASASLPTESPAAAESPSVTAISRSIIQPGKGKGPSKRRGPNSPRAEQPWFDPSVRFEQGVDEIFDQVWVKVQRRLAQPGSDDQTDDEEASISHHNIQSIIVTSWSPEEGSSTTALGLAARAGEAFPGRVCLVDADSHGRDLTRASGSENRPGLAELLAEDRALDEILIGGGDSGFVFLPTGRHVESEGLADDARMQQVVRSLEDRFRYVFYDTSCLKRGVEAYRFGRFVVNAILVVRAGLTRRQTVTRAVDQMKLHGMSLLGTVLNHRVDTIPNWLYPYV